MYSEHEIIGGGFIAPMAVGSMPEEKRPANCVGCRSCEWVCLQRINGQLLDAAPPFHRAMTTAQCIQYALDRPGVLTVLPGPSSVAELAEILDTPAPWGWMSG